MPELCWGIVPHIFTDIWWIHHYANFCYSSENIVRSKDASVDLGNIFETECFFAKIGADANRKQAKICIVFTKRAILVFSDFLFKHVREKKAILAQGSRCIPASPLLSPRCCRPLEGSRGATGTRFRASTWGSSKLGWKVRSARDRTIRTSQIGVRSEFREILLELLIRNQTFQDFSTFSRIFGELPRKFHQNLSKIQWKRFANS